MGIVIDHAARKHDIVMKSIQLFAAQGYDDVTYQKIANDCGIARTALYKYFQNKRAIFNAAIFSASTYLVDRYAEILSAKNPTPVYVRLECVMTTVTELLFAQRVFLTVIIDFVLAMQRSGHDMQRPIKQHTMGLRRIVHSLILEGVRTGEFRKLTPKIASDQIYAQLEATVLRITVSRNADFEDSMAMLRATLQSFLNPARCGKESM